jgi:hypothetical protein
MVWKYQSCSAHPVGRRQATRKRTPHGHHRVRSSGDELFRHTDSDGPQTSRQRRDSATVLSRADNKIAMSQPIGVRLRFRRSRKIASSFSLGGRPTRRRRTRERQAARKVTGFVLWITIERFGQRLRKIARPVFLRLKSPNRGATLKPRAEAAVALGYGVTTMRREPCQGDTPSRTSIPHRTNGDRSRLVGAFSWVFYCRPFTQGCGGLRPGL